MVCMFQEICEKSIKFHYNGTFDIVIPGSEIPKWFTHQSVGDIVSAQVSHQNENKWIGIDVCAVYAIPQFWGLFGLCNSIQ